MAGQHTRITVRLREMILNGSFAPGEHIAEVQLARTMGVSRTPVRLALSVLEHEGLVSSAPHRGFTVRSFSLEEIGEAIDLRGTLEGMAARLAAERGLTAETAGVLRDCLGCAETLLAGGRIEPERADEYEAMNVRFHDAIVAAAGNRALAGALSHNDKIPFASAGAVAFQDEADMYRTFALGHSQHLAIVEALAAGQSARAEALMREHALIAKKSLNLLQAAGHDPRPHAARGLRLVRP